MEREKLPLRNNKLRWRYKRSMSKTDLVQHYLETLHAELLYERIMQLDTRASEYLVSVYDKKARDKHEEE